MLGYHGKEKLPPTLPEKYLIDAVSEMVVYAIQGRVDDAQRIVDTVGDNHGSDGLYWLAMGLAEVGSNWTGMKQTMEERRAQDPGGFMGLVVRRGTGCCPDHSDEFEDVNPEDLTDPYERDQAMMMRFLVGYVHDDDATTRGVHNAYLEDGSLGLFSALCSLAATYGRRIMGELSVQFKMKEMFPGYEVKMPYMGEFIWKEANE